ncbi:MAG TPA: AAA family ATPase, partial [Pirellulales bacterium]|nr:AAA family ATPase [Pirellulales bacterium]
PDDNTVVEPGALGKYLGRLDRETFETMFGLDHATLVRGGREIVEGKGSLGQVLFAAGSGIANLKCVQDQLEKEAADLFSPAARAKNPRINAQLTDWQAARKAVTAAQLPSSEWERLDKACRETREQLAKTEQEWERARIEHARLTRLHQAIPLAARSSAATAEIAELGPVQILPDGFAERRRETATRVATASSAARSAAEAIAELDGQIEKLVVPEALLARGESIEQLAKDLGSYRKAQHDARGLVAGREQVESDARRSLKQLRPDLTLADVERLRLTRQQRVEIQNLGNKHGTLTTQCQQARENVAALGQRLAATTDELAGLPPPRNADLLKSVLRRAQSVSRIEEERAEASAELARLETQAAAALSRLNLWRGTLEVLETLAVPSVETIDAYETRLAETDRQVTALAEQTAKLEASRDQFDRQMRQVTEQGVPPSEAALDDARQRRDEGWRLVRRAWLEGSLDSAEAGLFAGRHVGPDGLADAFDQSLRQADEIADRLRHEADRVAARATLAAQRQACLDELSKIATAKETAVEAREAVAAEWQSLWRPLGIEPQSPREMRGWQRRQQSLLEQAEKIRKQKTDVDAFDSRTAKCRQELDRALAALNEPTAQPGETLAAQLERGQLLAEQIDAAAARHARLTDEAATLGRQLEAERAKAAAAERELSAWTARWSSAVAALGLSADATPAQANEVLAQLDALFDQLTDADRFRQRIDGIAHEAEEFGCQTRSLLESLGKAEWFDRMSADQAADAVLADYRRATEDRGRLETLRKQRQKHAAALAEAKQIAAQSRAELASLCQEANCDSADRLPDLEARSARAKELHAQQRDLHEQLVVSGGGVPLADFLAEIACIEPDGLPDKIQQLGERVSSLDARRIELSNAAALHGKEMADMDTSAAAAEAEELAQSLAATIAGDVESYVRLRLASAVLREAIERYREKNQGPVLQRASRLFAELTVGSFSGLRADYDDRDEAVLVGIRARDGRTVTVDGMSDGTADQLYLALRLASLETYLDEHDPVPLVVDDILINFDNRRSLATLKVLADLSQRTQVVFFTHHEHLVALAEEHLPTEVVFTHRLGQSNP